VDIPSNEALLYLRFPQPLDEIFESLFKNIGMVAFVLLIEFINLSSLSSIRLSPFMVTSIFNMSW